VLRKYLFIFFFERVCQKAEQSEKGIINLMTSKDGNFSYRHGFLCGTKKSYLKKITLWCTESGYAHSTKKRQRYNVSLNGKFLMERLSKYELRKNEKRLSIFSEKILFFMQIMMQIIIVLKKL
jgi:hypothetical protein